MNRSRRRLAAAAVSVVMSASLLSSMPAVYAESDMNGDGVIDIFDYILAKRTAIEEAAPLVLSISDAEGTPGETVSMEVSLGQNPGCISMALVLDYSPELIPVEAKDSDSAIRLSEDQFTEFHAQTEVLEDAHRLFYYTMVVTRCEENGKLFTVDFKIPETAEPGTSYTMTLSQHDITGLSYEELPMLTGRGRIKVVEQPPAAEPYVVTGIDISQWQGNVDFVQLKESAAFVMMRAGFGRLSTQVDKQFYNNYNKAKAAGMPIGAYWYSYAMSPEEARLEAQACMEVLGDRSFEYPIALDIEEKKQLALGVDRVSAIITAFCDEMEKAGYYVSVYAPAWHLNNTVNQQVKNTYDIWVANVNVAKTIYIGSYGMWQYSWTGRVSGVSTAVDMDYCYRDYPAIMKRTGLNKIGS